MTIEVPSPRNHNIVVGDISKEENLYDHQNDLSETRDSQNEDIISLKIAT